MDDALREGHFARKQMFCSAGLIAWSHRRRFEVGVELARPFAGKRLLDYGCGDGTYLALLMASTHAPAIAVGAEIDPGLVAANQSRFAQTPNLRFVHVRDLAAQQHTGKYDAVVCMEVFEHLVEVEPVLEGFARLLAPAGMLLLSVPVETGLPLLVKQTARRIAGWRGVGDYPGTTPYRWSELCAGLFAGARQHIERPRHRNTDGSEFHDHKGFNWMALREIIARRFELERTVASPLTWLTPHLASQVWFVARKRNGTGASAR
jgi:SAM-dependent methyltransferase